MATKKDAAASPQASDYRKAEIAGIIDEVNSIVKISTISLTAEDRLNTGLLCLDLVYGGGLAPGMHVTFGPEQSAKTTAAITVMGASVAQDVDMRVLWDAENSTGSSTDYVANIFQTNGVKATVEDIFQGDESKGEVPLVFYRDDYEGEKFFNWLHAVEKRLPDKRFDEGRWWYVYDEKNKKAVERVKAYADKRMTSKNEGIWVPAEDGRAQLIILLDSFPSLVSASMDDDEGDNSIAVQARMFSKQIPRIKGALRAKRIVFLGINQLRLNPMARFGNPETEPGGQALKFFSDTRMRNFPRALSGVPYNPKGEGQIEKEASTLGEGEDTYRYIHVRAHKNKLAIPGRETWLRLWVSDANGDARGYDPVWDTFYYLEQTGQLSGKRHQIKLNIAKLGEATKTVTWLEFKRMVLDPKASMDIFKKVGLKPVNIRAGCLNQIRKGVAEKLYIETHRARLKNKKDDTDN